MNQLVFINMLDYSAQTDLFLKKNSRLVSFGLHINTILANTHKTFGYIFSTCKSKYVFELMMCKNVGPATSFPTIHCKSKKLALTGGCDIKYWVSLYKKYKTFMWWCVQMFLAIMLSIRLLMGRFNIKLTVLVVAVCCYVPLHWSQCVNDRHYFRKYLEYRPIQIWEI